MRVSELETPAVVVDLDVMDRNLARMGDYCRQRRLRLRPHTKSHKIPELAHRQLESGAHGITVAKIGEAEVMLDAGMTDILIAYPIVGLGKPLRLAELAARATVTVSLDSEDAARAISAAMTEMNLRCGILVELDVGFGRCGVSNARDLLALAQTIDRLSGLEFKGIMFFPGQFVVEPEKRASLLEGVNELLAHVADEFERVSLPIEIVSGGSTPTAYDAHQFRGVNEIRPGMYIFNDRNMTGVGVATLDDCALSVIVTVVSNSVEGRAIIDGGSKTFSSDRYLAGDGRGFGIIREDLDAELEGLSEEHGHMNLRKTETRFRVGDRLTIVPNHVCSTVNMHNEIYGVRGDHVETVWQVAGRGKVK